MPPLAPIMSSPSQFSEFSVNPSTRLRTIRLLTQVNGLQWSDAEQIEQGINKFSSISNYVNTCKKLSYNLCYNSNIASGNTRLDEIASLPDEAMASDILKRFQEEETQRSESIMKMLKEKYDNVNSTDISYSMLSCRVCGSSDISWQQKQTRGADESMTIFCTCVNCKNRWKMS